MTLVELQDDLLDRLNLSTDDARTRLTRFINQRLRHVQTSVGIRARVRRGTVTATTTSGVRTLVPSGIIKPLSILLPAWRRPLDERSSTQLRHYDPSEQWTGVPSLYAVAKYAVNSFTLEFAPSPNDAYDLTIDGVLAGANLVADGDVPALPEDFHDILVWGALADEQDHFKNSDESLKYEQKFEKRMKELRYFMATSAYLSRVPGRRTVGRDSGWWWMIGPPSA